MKTIPVHAFTNTTHELGELAFPIPDGSDRPDTATATVNADQLQTIAELLDVIDGFLRSDNIAELLTAYLHSTGADQPRPPHGASYTTDLLIDPISFNAHHMRNRHEEPLK
jgi:hypothetical protein